MRDALRWEEISAEANARAEQPVAGLGVSTEVSSVIGDPGHAIRELSESVDLIVVGSRRWGPVARLITGGVGETVVACAGCSVLLVPRPANG
jgi:nucleotide-binding universal stress UspA family protein